MVPEKLFLIVGVDSMKAFLLEAIPFPSKQKPNVF